MAPTPNTTNTLSDVHALRARGRPHVTVCCAGCVLGAATMLHGIRVVCVELGSCTGTADTQSQIRVSVAVLGVASLWCLAGLYQCARALILLLGRGTVSAQCTRHIAHAYRTTRERHTPHALIRDLSAS